jgi:hypothetical protein
MALQIVAKKDGFRRGGIVHSGSKVYAKGALTKAQEKALRSEKMLVCIDVVEPEATAAEPTGKKGK